MAASDGHVRKLEASCWRRSIIVRDLEVGRLGSRGASWVYRLSGPTVHVDRKRDVDGLSFGIESGRLGLSAGGGWLGVLVVASIS